MSTNRNKLERAVTALVRAFRTLARNFDTADLFVIVFAVLASRGDLGGAVGALLAAFYIRLCLILRAIEKLHKEESR